MNKSKSELLQKIKEDLCDNYCLYRDTADENSDCDAIRNNGICPLNKLDTLLLMDTKEVLHV